MKTTILALAITAAATTSFAAEKLTKENIQSFYEESVEVQLAGEAEAIAFFEQHIHKDAKMVLNILTKIKNAPAQKETVSHDKSSLLKDTRTGYERSKLEELKSTVLSADIAEDGKSAKVKDTTYGVSIISIPSTWGTQAFRAEQSMLCDGEIILADGIIQSKDSTCNVEVKMEPVK